MDDGELEVGERASLSVAQLGLKFGERQFDGVEIWTVSGKLADGGAAARNQLGDGGDFLRGEACVVFL